MEVLAGDIGGTNARLAVVTIDDAGRAVMGRFAVYPSADAPGLAPIVREFLAAGAERPTHASFAVAGPVRGDEIDATNLPWRLAAPDLAAAIGIPRTRLLNDFLAVGYGLSQLGPGDIVTLQAGEADEPDGTLGLLGAGTGLGVAAVARARGRSVARPSEGGHASFAPQDALEDGLLAFLRAELGGHVSAERVVSGPGLVNLYRYLAAEGARFGLPPERAEVRAAMAASEVDAAVVTSRAFGAGGVEPDPLCAAAVERFARLYGAMAGSVALTLYATGGVYVAGGVTQHVLPALERGAFIAAFRAKGRMRPLLEAMPVHVVTCETVGLMGAAIAAWAGEG